MAFIPRKNPIDLPEIVQHICQHLCSTELSHCILVSQLWHSSFVPELYREMHISQGGCLDRLTDLTLAQYGHHVRDLTIELAHPLLKSFSLACRHLQELSLIVEKHKPRDRQNLIRLLDNNAGIQRIYIGGSDCYAILDGPPHLVRDVLEHSPSVNDLSLTYMELGPKDVQSLMFLRSNQLIKLFIEGVHLLHAGQIWEDAENGIGPRPYFPKLRDLELEWNATDMIPKEQVQWIGQCPALERLCWHIPEPTSEDLRDRYDPETGEEIFVDDRIEMSDAFGEMYRTLSIPVPGHTSAPTATGDSMDTGDGPAPPPPMQRYFCPQVLTSIQITNSEIPDYYFALMLELNPVPFKEISLPGSEFGVQSMAQMKRHFATLEILNLEDLFFGDDYPWISQVILSSCPKLREFEGGELNLYAKNPVSSYPKVWVCQGLEMLSVQISTISRDGCEQEDPETRLEILDRLSRLKNLRRLCLKVSKDWTVDGSDVDGARSARVPSLLRLFKFHHHNYFWDELQKSETLRWTVETWPKLTSLLCQEYTA
ncbi:hypothetical protein BGZ83_007992 [Gryganskiella cystojenkinii]|nr:hypothetical protein BGZ83_007992 [Gryganskiella cystojenkinii]